jgi:predicted O-methyltransferase YrrM
MKLRGSRHDIIDAVARAHPEVADVINYARQGTERCKGEIDDFQAAALYALARQYNERDASILEIGTAYGFSAAVLALATPQAHIVTLNPQEHEVKAARTSLVRLQLRNVTVLPSRSWERLPWNGGELSMVFVDGDHVRVRNDYAWWEYLRDGGLMFFHDYAPVGSARPCEPVYRALNEQRDRFREFDVLIVDDTGVGMAGWYKRRGEAWG